MAFVTPKERTRVRKAIMAARRAVEDNRTAHAFKDPKLKEVAGIIMDSARSVMQAEGADGAGVVEGLIMAMAYMILVDDPNFIVDEDEGDHQTTA